MDWRVYCTLNTVISEGDDRIFLLILVMFTGII